MSHSTHRRFSFSATAAKVPEPAKQSSTMSPSLEAASTDAAQQIPPVFWGGVVDELQAALFGGGALADVPDVIGLLFRKVLVDQFPGIVPGGDQLFLLRGPDALIPLGGLVQGDHHLVGGVAGGFGIPKDHIVIVGKAPHIALEIIGIVPYDLVDEVGLAEHLIQHDLDVVRLFPVQMDEDAALV